MAQDIDHPIIVTGCARSGTSLTAGIVHLCGAWGGRVIGAMRWNQKGQFENREIINSIEKPYLRSIGADPMGQYPLPQLHELRFDPTRRQRIKTLIRNQGYKNGPWYFKDAKACLTFLAWKDAFPEAKWIFVRRSKEAIMASCLRTPFMRKKIDWSRWVDAHLMRLEEMYFMQLDVQEFWPEKVIAGDFAYAQAFVKGLDLQWRPEAVQAFVTPSLWHYYEKKAA